MSESLGRFEDLPIDYRERLGEISLTPLWPALRNALPYGRPTRSAVPYVWHYRDIRPQLMRAGELTPIEKAERRVLVLCNPGYGLEGLRATPTIYCGLQLILPGEEAPPHKHSPCAVRFVVEGQGGYTLVDGEKLPMEKGDLILTPAGLWHEHGHEGDGPVVWLDALDLPLILAMEASYSVEGAKQEISDPNNTSTLRFATGGVIPYASLTPRRRDYPMLRFPWRSVRESLDSLASVTPAGELPHMAYVNPETGQECLPDIGFSALRLAPNAPIRMARRSASAVLHVIEGRGYAIVDGVRLEFEESDTIAVPTHADVTLEAQGASPAYLFMVDDAPLHRKLGIYETFIQG
jgi:gentisate 1,2-dioxygenase